jgi:23S rRNA (adenine2503-C2)-methyltransferase
LEEKPFRAKQIWEWLWKKGARSFQEMSTLPASLRQTLADEFLFQVISLDTLLKSEDKTMKLGFELMDGQKIEGVLIPSSSRTTACISTQSGCPLGCKFCATGKFGFKRNLSVGEIFDEVMILNDLSITQFQKPLSNIVIMGMGEPFLNYEAVMGAIEKITAPELMGMSPKRITLSTSGLVPEIMRFADANCGVQLAISLHSANQQFRESIMPIAKKYPLADLVKALKYYHEKTSERITLEYLLMEDVNDTLDDARELAAFCKNFPVKINLIQYNEVDGIPYKKPAPEIVSEFGSFLENKNLIVNIRRSRGTDIAAACGQLANKK